MIKQLKQAIHSYVSIPCFTCFMTLLLFYICHITTLLPCFKVWEIHVALLPFISNQVRNKQNMRMLHMYVSVTMAWWHRWCICLWNDMQFSGSQTPRVLQMIHEIDPTMKIWPGYGRDEEPMEKAILFNKETICKSLSGAPTVDRISSIVLRGVSHEGRLISREAWDQEQEGNRDTRVRQVQAVSMT